MSGPWIAAFGALCTIVAVLALTVLGTLRRVSVVLEQAESILRTRVGSGPGGLPPGTPIPDFEGLFSDGSQFTRSSLLGTPSVIVFLSRNCPACRALEEDLAGRDLSDLGTRAIAVVDDPRDADLLAMVAGFEAVVQTERSIADAFGSNATPHAFVIDAGGVIAASGTPNAFDSLKRLVSSVEGGDRTDETEAMVHA